MKKFLVYYFILCSISLQAQLIFQDDFANYNTNVSLNGQGLWTNNSSNAGGLGTTIAGGSPSFVVAEPISYLGYGTSTNSNQIKPNSDGCGLSFAPVTSGDIYFGLVLNISAAQANNNSDFFRVMSESNFNTTFRLYITPGTFGGFFLGVAKGANGNPISFSSTESVFGENHLVIIKYTQGSGVSDDVIKVFIDPVFANGEPTMTTMTTSSGIDQAGSIDRMALRQNWTNGMPTGRSGLFSISTTWDGLQFPNLAKQNFTSSNFIVVSNQAKNGQISIQSETSYAKTQLSIYDLQSRIIESKQINLKANLNQIEINPISKAGIYIVKLLTESFEYTQKINVN